MTTGIEALDALGIAHRDISAGNVLLSVNDPRPGYEGFISDFEFANIPGVKLEFPQGPNMIVSSEPFLVMLVLNFLSTLR